MNDHTEMYLIHFELVNYLLFESCFKLSNQQVNFHTNARVRLQEIQKMPYTYIQVN